MSSSRTIGQGVTGDIGPTGAPLPGLDGEDGMHGVPGPTGADGPAGATGPEGPAGPSIPGIDGEDGASGIPGPAGDAGAQGATGADGPAGPPIPGIDGEDGTPGIPGPAGEAGATGSTGAAGADGQAGAPIPGPDGEDGAWGPPGASGADGAVGATGTTGADGPAGPPIPGIDGEDGIGWPGPAGADGAAASTDVTARYGVADCRLEYSSSTQVRLNAYGGQYIDVNGTIETVDGSATADQLNTTENLLSSTGTDSGGAMGASTLYYVYRSSAAASYAASQTRASTTAPSAYRGSKYLGTSGNAAEWRLVGMVRTNGSTNFVNSTAARLVISYYNRHLISAMGVYTANRTATTGSLNEVNSEIRAEILSWDDEHVYVDICGSVDSNVTVQSLGIGVDSTSAYSASTIAAPVVTILTGFSVHWSGVLSAGYHYSTILTNVVAKVTLVFYYADSTTTAACRNYISTRG